jgi:hypothetical protein
MASHLTSELIFRQVHDPATDSLKVSLTGTNFAIAVSHLDNDSVYAVKRSVIVEANTTVDARGFSTICLYATGNLEVSPSDEGEDFITIPASVGQVVNICARRVRVGAKAVMNG